MFVQWLCRLGWFGCLCWGTLSPAAEQNASIPLPEHPRPDFQRTDWLNLNGDWDFEFDSENAGIQQQWFQRTDGFSRKITVPFSWGSKLSGVSDDADIGWYHRTITIPESWKGQRVFLVVGACDWHSTVWLDGEQLGVHQGGYTPFAFDLTPHVQLGKPQHAVLRVDDTPHPFKLEGKQGYGRAAGIWQTVYLEARPQVAIDTVHFTPDIDTGRVAVEVTLDQPAPSDMSFALKFPEGTQPLSAEAVIQAGAQQHTFSVVIKDARLWSLDDPYLYDVTAELTGEGVHEQVTTYFGMRKVSVGQLPGTEHPYVMLNNKPIYLQLALDQAYHPDGYYTFPSDRFMRDEILRSRQIGLNGQRIHIKVEIPRKLYWADRLGLLIMADVPNFWGPPNEQARAESEYALRGMIRRDYNHPAIFSWVNFNETWGLRTGDEGYKPETQEWVASIYRLTKELDSTRLVEDNSPCNHDHVETDLNTWHAYLPGYRWQERLDEFCEKTHPGSKWNFIGNRVQASQPMFNSECGNVWGYQGSTGDVDWSWDYHIMMNEFRRHPKVCGWLYTEHHDVINEWNGYWRFDRSKKYTGMSDLAREMTLRDLHGAFYVASERELCRQVSPGQKVSVPLYVSCMTDADVGGPLTIQARLYGWDTLAHRRGFDHASCQFEYRPWMQQELPPLSMEMPEEPGLAVLALSLVDSTGSVLHRNFTTYLVADQSAPRNESIERRGQRWQVVRFAPNSFKDASWSRKQWEVLGGLKVNGAGSGYFEYEVDWPAGLAVDEISAASLRMELSAKQLFGKDRDDGDKQEGDFMRGKGTHDPSSNPNSYPMTDEQQYPSAVQVRVMGQSAGVVDLLDDPADHRGILSWYSQKRDGRLREAGSYGQLVDVSIPAAALRSAASAGKLTIRLEVDSSLPGGVAIYGERFGRYPLDPTLVFALAP